MGVNIRTVGYIVSITVLCVAVATTYVHSQVGSDWPSWDAKGQQEFYWKRIMGRSGTTGRWPTALESVNLFIESMKPTMDHLSEELPSGRQKLIHGVGAIAQCRFNWLEQLDVYQVAPVSDGSAPRVSSAGRVKNPFTGMFKQADYGFVRVSGALKWTTGKKKFLHGDKEYPVTAEKGGFTPGMGVKFFRTNAASANFVAMRALQPQDSWNPFQYPWSNHISHENLGSALKLVASKFMSVSQWASFVGLSDWGITAQDGSTLKPHEAQFPYQLIFMPNPIFKQAPYDKFLDPIKNGDMVEMLTTIPTNTKLFDVYAPIPNDVTRIDPNDTGIPIWRVPAGDQSTLNLVEFPKKHSEGYEKKDLNGYRIAKIGELGITNQFVKSVYADEVLFFKHQRFDEDLKLRPGWVSACKDVYSCNVCPGDFNCVHTQPTSFY